MKTAQECLSLFKKYKKKKDGYMVECPCHEDNKESLSIKDSYDALGNHKLLVKCFAGCDSLQILAYINGDGQASILPKAVLEAMASGTFKPKQSENVKLTLKNVYNYTDEQGECLYQVLRFEPKTFRYRRPATIEEQKELEELGADEKQSKWIYKTDNVRKVLYNLKYIESAKRKNYQGFVYKVEGEKTCDLLFSKKLLGICNPFGAGTDKWLPEYSQSIAGLNIVLIPDNDPTGYNHIYEVFDAIKGVVNSVRIVQPPVRRFHDDLYDWMLFYDGTPELLNKMAEEAEELSNKDLDYVKSRYYFDSSFLPKEEIEENLTTKPVNNEKPVVYDGLEFIAAKRLIADSILKSEGPNAGLCNLCLGSGFLLSGDGRSALGVQEDPEASPVLRLCDHGLNEISLEGDFDI